MKDRFIYTLRLLAIGCLFALLTTTLALFPLIFLIWLFTGINLFYILCDKLEETIGEIL